MNFRGRLCCILEHLDGVYVEMSMNPNHQYRLWTSVFLIRLTEHSVNRHLREFNTLKKTLPSGTQHDTLQETIAFADKRKSLFGYSYPGGTLENKLNDLKPLFSRKKSLTFQKRSGAAFAGERRFSKSRGLSASVSFLPFPLPPLSFFWLLFNSRAAKT